MQMALFAAGWCASRHSHPPALLAAACCAGCATWQRNFNLIPRLTLR